MKEIDGNAITIRDLLSNKKYGLDYYQREYKWQTKQVLDLIDDLMDAFKEHYDPAHDPEEVEDYGVYFLGSMVTSPGKGKTNIIDGQQRLTTLTLLLIYIHHNIEDNQEREMIAPLIKSRKARRNTFNIDVKERNVCMNRLYESEDLEIYCEYDDSSINIINRYKDVEERFKEACTETEEFDLTYFMDWLIDHVYLVEITAADEADAYVIFETMNDRGLSLTPAEMLRGYLLASIDNVDRRNKALTTWDERVGELRRLGKEEDADAIKSWLRSQHAETIRVNSRSSESSDFDLIGNEFHRWVQSARLGLKDGADYAGFIEREFDFYGRWYSEMRRASNSKVEGLDPFFYIHQNKFTLQYMAAMSPLTPFDSDATVICKLRTVATFIDCVLYRRIWNGRAISHSMMRVPMFRDVALNVRHLDEKALAETLCAILDQYQERFVENNFSLNAMNRPKIHQMLARMTDYIETQSAMGSSYVKYRNRGRSEGSYEIEHVLSQRHRADLPDFDYHRNKVGALVLLPGPVNASVGDMPYDEKRKRYLKENLLAASLHDLAHVNAPGFRRFKDKFKEDTCLDFKSYDVFDETAINERQELYRQLAMRIWSTDSIREAAGLA